MANGSLKDRIEETLAKEIINRIGQARTFTIERDFSILTLKCSVAELEDSDLGIIFVQIDKIIILQTYPPPLHKSQIAIGDPDLIAKIVTMITDYDQKIYDALYPED